MSASELLDVVDEHGRPIGVRTRADVHREGLWHRCLHLWVVTGDREVLLQRRARAKAAWGGKLDATAAGHLTAGEAILDGLREAEEELGVAFTRDQVRPLGVRAVTDRPVPGTVNREIQHVYLARSALPLDGWTALDPTEVDGLVAVALPTFSALVHDATPAAGRSWDGRVITAVEVRPGELVPSPYLGDLAVMLERLDAVSGPPVP